MGNSVVQTNEEKIHNLEGRLQKKGGMIWLLGEIMKEAVNIRSFKQLMSILTDMLMGVMGVTTCYLCIKNNHQNEGSYVVYYRSTQLQNEFKEQKLADVPSEITEISHSQTYSKEEITRSLIEQISLPKSRLSVALKDFSDESIFGALVLEHEEEDFFTEDMVSFFETLAIFISINSQNSKILQTVSKESQTDPLTGTYNRRHLDMALKKMSKVNESVTVAVIDTDNFKTINDRLGHLTGDSVLKAIANLAKRSVGEYGGEVVRYGGDEFIIMIPLPLIEAIHILDDFRKAVYYIQITYNIPIPITVTLGVCDYPSIVKSIDWAIEVADRALMRGKEEGKNKIEVATLNDLQELRDIDV